MPTHRDNPDSYQQYLADKRLRESRTHTAVDNDSEVVNWIATRRWSNLFSLRALLGSMIVAGVVVALVDLVLPFLAGPVGFVVFVVWHVGVMTNPKHTLYCRWCGKRTKTGAARCHHCGQLA